MSRMPVQAKVVAPASGLVRVLTCPDDGRVALDAMMSHLMRSTEGDVGGLGWVRAGRGRAAVGRRDLAAVPGGTGLPGDVGRLAQPAAGPEPGVLHDRRAGEDRGGVRPARGRVPVALDGEAGR